MSQSSPHSEVRNEHPLPTCCQSGHIGWLACPREWMCPGAKPIYRTAFTRLYQKSNGGWVPIETQLALSTKERPTGELWPNFVGSRIEYLKYLWDRARSWGGWDPGVRP